MITGAVVAHRPTGHQIAAAPGLAPPSAPNSICTPPLRFTVQEFIGSLGDLGTFVPLVFGLCAACGFDVGTVLITAGMLNIATGLLFRQPLPVQPMKAMAAIAIAGSFSPAEVAAGGLIVALSLLVLAMTDTVDWIARRIPKPVVRGIQLSLGLKLVQTGVEWLTGLRVVDGVLIRGPGLPWLGLDSLLTAVLVAAVLFGWTAVAARRTALAAPPPSQRGGSTPDLLARDRREYFRWGPQNVPKLLVLCGTGVLVAVGAAQVTGAFGLPSARWELVIPGTSAWSTGLWSLAPTQLPLTLLNSVVAVCALSSDYFPGRGVPPRRMALSVAWMNLLTIPLGGVPMCHGAGGLAAQYRLGARTGGSIIMLGGLKVAAGLLFGAALAGFLGGFPRSILAVTLLLAGASLAVFIRECRQPVQLFVAAGTALGILLINAPVGVGLGMGLAAVLHCWQAHKDASEEPSLRFADGPGPYNVTPRTRTERVCWNDCSGRSGGGNPVNQAEFAERPAGGGEGTMKGRVMLPVVPTGRQLSGPVLDPDDAVGSRFR